MNWLRIGSGVFLALVAAVILLATVASARENYPSYREMFAAWLSGILLAGAAAAFIVLCVLALIELVTGHL